ncbi:hypothetical protein AVEN_106990-1 [Araneus ventricosus]|uniref:Uncharacterized protein n=1 Tax=Araneus ventricosus TaxID=182803 RepID=A0A4Y2R9I6_ARAVE|nr:hypothetical protein AVEN_106990-1 [Araneus ventricosus]
MHEKNLLEKGAMVSNFRSRESAFLQYFRSDGFVYYHNVHSLMEELGILAFHANEWQLFNDSSKRSLKCVLFYNGNLFGAVPLGPSNGLREEYEDIKRVIDLFRGDCGFMKKYLKF